MCNNSGDGSVLVTGGAGYIGSHTVLELVGIGYEVVVVDNMANASIESIRRIEEITGRKVTCYVVDLLHKSALEEIFKKHKFSCVVHFAGLKAVGESVELPLAYYKNNMGGTLNLVEVMKMHNVYNLVFSSSASVYGDIKYLPVDEKHPTGNCLSPYGRTKHFVECILMDIAAQEKNWNIISLRYFNPVGAHKSGKIGEDPTGIPNNLMPFMAQVAVGKRAELKVFGNDYDTPDGTAIRDYIHVVDLALGHVAAMKKIGAKCGYRKYNLGTGCGYSVLEIIKAFEKQSGKSIAYKFVARRPGDVPINYADSSLAEKELGWKATENLDQMCADLWRWQSANPHGYHTQHSEQG